MWSFAPFGKLRTGFDRLRDCPGMLEAGGERLILFHFINQKMSSFRGCPRCSRTEPDCVCRACPGLDPGTANANAGGGAQRERHGLRESIGLRASVKPIPGSPLSGHPGMTIPVAMMWKWNNTLIPFVVSLSLS